MTGEAGEYIQLSLESELSDFQRDGRVLDEDGERDWQKGIATLAMLTTPPTEAGIAGEPTVDIVSSAAPPPAEEVPTAVLPARPRAHRLPVARRRRGDDFHSGLHGPVSYGEH
jgi:hypothetical protein